MKEKIAVEFVTTARLGEKGQFTVPKNYRDGLELSAGAPFAVLRIGKSLMLVPEQARFEQLCDRIASVFSRHGIQASKILETLPEARQRVFKRRYPHLANDLSTGVAQRKKARVG